MFFSNGKVTPHNVVEESYTVIIQVVSENKINARTIYFALPIFLEGFMAAKKSKDYTRFTLMQQQAAHLINNYYRILLRFDKDVLRAIGLVVKEDVPLPQQLIKQLSSWSLSIEKTLDIIKTKAQLMGALYPAQRLDFINTQHKKNIHIQDLIPKRNPVARLSADLILPTAVSASTQTLKTLNDWVELLCGPSPSQRVIIGESGAGKTELVKSIAHYYATQHPDKWLFLLSLEQLNLLQDTCYLSITQLLQLYYFPNTLDKKFQLEQLVFENALWKAIQLDQGQVNSNVIFILDGYMGMGQHDLTPLKQLLKLPNVMLACAPIDLKLLQQQGLLTKPNAVFHLIGFDNNDLKNYIQRFFKKGFYEYKPKDLHKAVDQNFYTRSLMHHPEMMEIACIADSRKFIHRSPAIVYEHLLMLFFYFSRFPRLPSHFSKGIELIDKYMPIAYRWFIKGTLHGPEADPAWRDMNLFVEIAPGQYRFVTAAIHAYLAARHIAHKQIDPLILPKTVSFSMLALTYKFLVNIWLDAHNTSALESFFQGLVDTVHNPPCPPYDKALLLRITWDEVSFAIAAQSYRKLLKPQLAVPMALSTATTRKVTAALAKKTPTLYIEHPVWKLYDQAARNKELLAATAQNDTSRVHALLAQGAHVNTQDTNGNTPLHLACMNATRHTVQPGLLQLLIVSGADITFKNKDNEMVYQAATRIATAVLSEVLKELKASPELIQQVDAELVRKDELLTKRLAMR